MRNLDKVVDRGHEQIETTIKLLMSHLFAEKFFLQSIT